MHGEPVALGNTAHVVLVQVAQRKHRLGERRLADGMQEIALVLVVVDALQKRGLASDFGRACVVAGRQQFAAEAFRIVAKHAELDFAIAQYVRVRRAAGTVFVEKIVEDSVAILGREIGVVQRYAELIADAACVLQVLGGRAIAVVVFPVGHVQRLHVGAGLDQAQRSHGGIDPAGESQDDAPACQ